MERVKKENKKKIMEMIEKAGSEEYETSWNEKGIPVSKKKSEIVKGRMSRAQGARFELKVREELESTGWIVDKWSNNVDFSDDVERTGKLVKAKRKYNPFKKMLVVGTGFPDFIAFRLNEKDGNNYEVIGVEVKMNGTLSKVEKEKCRWLLENKVFSKILIAKKSEKRGKVDYVEFGIKNNKI